MNFREQYTTFSNDFGTKTEIKNRTLLFQIMC